MTRLMVLLSCLVLLAWGAASAQGRSGENTALSLRSNVVKITTHLSSEENGFGFVVAETSGKLYIVTANHVVRDVTGADRKPRVTFYQDPGKTYVGELLATHLTSEQGDIALLRITTPQGFTWKRDAISTEAARRDVDVWFIGRSGDWYVPTRSAEVNKIEPTGTILVDGLPLASGTSGAPLISATGITGLIIRDDGAGYSEATPVDVIRRAIDDWHYPWQLVPEGALRPSTSLRWSGAAKLSTSAGNRCPPSGTLIPFAKVMNEAFADSYEGCNITSEVEFLAAGGTPNYLWGSISGLEGKAPFRVEVPGQEPGGGPFDLPPHVFLPKDKSDVIFSFKKGDLLIVRGAPLVGSKPLRQIIFLATEVQAEKQ